MLACVCLHALASVNVCLLELCLAVTVSLCFIAAACARLCKRVVACVREGLHVLCAC